MNLFPKKVFPKNQHYTSGWYGHNLCNKIVKHCPMHYTRHKPGHCCTCKWPSFNIARSSAGMIMTANMDLIFLNFKTYLSFVKMADKPYNVSTHLKDQYIYNYLIHHINPSLNHSQEPSVTNTAYCLYDQRLSYPDSSWDQRGAHLGPPGPRWAPCWPQEPCYLGMFHLFCPYY